MGKHNCLIPVRFGTRLLHLGNMLDIVMVKHAEACDDRLWVLVVTHCVEVRQILPEFFKMVIVGSAEEHSGEIFLMNRGSSRRFFSIGGS